jgi:hypothetical protein
MNCRASTSISHPWLAPRESTGGGTGRGTGPGAGCSPSGQQPADGKRRGSNGDCVPCRGAKSLPAQELRRSSPGGVLCRPPALAWLSSRLRRQPWRERPRVLSRSAIASATRGGRSRHGCPARVEALRLAFPCVDTTAKPSQFFAAVLSRRVPRNERVMCSCQPVHGGPMPLIKPRTRGKQLVRHIARLDRETNETLYAYAHFPRRAHRLRAEPGDRHRAREGQGVSGVARRTS